MPNLVVYVPAKVRAASREWKELLPRTWRSEVPGGDRGTSPQFWPRAVLPPIDCPACPEPEKVTALSGGRSA